jgi:mono/diheme cytochrome c family protein
MLKMNRILYIAFIAASLILSNDAFSRAWKAPEEAKSKNSYIKFDASTSSQGEVLYNANCASCHGNPGKNNSLKSLNPVPPDLSTTASQKLTDGELLHIIVNGAGLMPSFKNTLSEEKVWYIVSYLREFNKGYIQELSKFDPAKSKLVKLTTTYNKATNSILVNAVANEANGVISLAGVEISVFIKRYFGNLQVEKAVRTDASGNASFSFPKDIPGNKTGDVELITKFFDDNYGEVQSKDTFQIGVPTDKPSLSEERALWNTLAKAPFWIIGLYSLGVIGFLALLGFLLNNIRKIFKSKS